MNASGAIGRGSFAVLRRLRMTAIRGQAEATPHVSSRPRYPRSVTIAMRIVVLRPPPGVTFAMQSGRAELVPPSAESSASITFDFELRVGERVLDAPPRLLGPFAQGPPLGRFVYVNSGKHAGQPASCWDRRAKVPLAGVTWALIDEVLATRGGVLEAQIAGTGRDGGPACATVPLAQAWRVAR